MAENVLTVCDLMVGGYNFTGQSYEVTWDQSREMKDKTVFRATRRLYKPGLMMCAAAAKFFWAAGVGSVDEQFFDQLDNNEWPFSWWPLGADDGNIGYAIQAERERYNITGTLGELIAGELGVVPGAGLIMRPRSLVFGTKTTSTDGTGYQHGAVAATERATAFMHVFSAAGTSPTLDVLIESDDNAGFTSATTRFTFTQASAIGSEVMASVSGAITDDYWRATWTIGGSDTPTFNFLVGLDIGPLP